MRIGVDTRDLTIAHTGTRTYLEESLAALQTLHKDIVTLHPQDTEVATKRDLVTKISGHASFYYWKMFQLPQVAKQHQCDILFCTDFTIPMGSPIPAIPVFHGANFWVNPQQYNKVWRTLFNLMTVPAAKRAPKVVTTTEFARKELIQHVGFTPDQIVAIPIAPKTKAIQPISELDVDKFLAEYEIDRNIPFLLHVGVMEKRKNLVRLIQAFKLFQEQTPIPHQLILVGRRAPQVDMDDSQNIVNTINQLGLQNSVKMVGHVTDEALPAFYQGATMFVFPADREGFGIPVLEAFSQNLPVAAANSSAIPEVAGDAAILFDPYDPQAIASAMLRIAQEPALRQELIEKGKLRRQNFGWDKTAQQLIDLFERVLKQQ